MHASAQSIEEIYHRLHVALGPQHWWPADSPTEVIIGAILTQNTAWTNVQRAIENLKSANLLDFKKLRVLPDADLEHLIKPAGTYRVKTKRLRAFINTLWQNHAGRLEDMLGPDLQTARSRLLAITGIGPETADAILLYAGNLPTFVVDTYTTRILRRHHLIDPRLKPARDYHKIQQLFHNSLPQNPKLFNEFHALLVQLAKTHCRTRATCDTCPISDMPHDPLL